MNTYRYDQIRIGQEESFSALIGQKEMDLFRRITGDENPLHTKHGIVYGMLTASYLSTLAGMYLPGERSLIHKVEVQFPHRLELLAEQPVKISVKGTVSEKNDTFNTIVIKFSITDESGEKVARGNMRVGVRGTI